MKYKIATLSSSAPTLRSERNRPSRRVSLRPFAIVCLAAIFATHSTSTVFSAGLLIHANGRRDHVFDSTRGLLYVTTSSGTLLRYSPATNSFLSPFTLSSTALNGVDITPDAAAAYAVDNVGTGGGLVHRVDLNTGLVTNIPYGNQQMGENGGWDIAIGSNGIGMVTTQYAGSGWVPLRQLDTSTNTLSIRSDAPTSDTFNHYVRQNTQVSRSVDRRTLLLAEGNISSGPTFLYNAPTNSFYNQSDKNGFPFFSAVNRDGSLFALEIGEAPGTSIYDSQTETLVHRFPGQWTGCVFDPVRDLFYSADQATDQILIYETAGWNQIGQLAVGENFSGGSFLGIGTMSISDDGQFLFMSTPMGIRMFTVPEPSTLFLAACGLLSGALARLRRASAR
jgi:hypothetical protein